MGRRDGAGEPVGEREVDRTVVCQMIERPRLIEATHLDRPLDRLAATAERQLAVAFAGNRDHAKIEVGCKGTIDLELRLAGCAPPPQCREIEKRVFHCALDLQGAPACEKHGRRMRVGASHRSTAMGRRITEKSEDLRLKVVFGLGVPGLGVLWLGIPSHGLPCCRRSGPWRDAMERPSALINVNAPQARAGDLSIQYRNARSRSLGDVS